VGDEVEPLEAGNGEAPVLVDPRPRPDGDGAAPSTADGPAPATADGPAGPAVPRREGRAAHLARPGARYVVLGSLILYLGSRAAGYLAVLTSTWLAPTLRVSKAYTAWDSGWYIRIAQHGYPNTLASEAHGNRWAFFPGFPAVIRGTKEITGLSYTDAAILAAWILGGLAAVAIGLLVRDVFGDQTALKAVALVMFFPSAFILNVAYAEGLLLTAIALCLLCIHRERWVLAVLLAIVAGLTKESGVVLVVAIAAESLRPGRTVKARIGILVAAAASSLGFIAFVAYGWARTGHVLAFVSAQKAWNGHFVWFETPFKTVWDLLTTRSAWHQAPYVAAGFAFVAVVVGFVYLIRLQLRGGGVSPAWWGYAIAGTLVTFSPYWQTSILRYALVPLPVFAAAYAKLARPRLLELTVGVFGVFQGAIAIVVFVGLVNGHPLLAP
jgi:hypothetical protein